MRIAIGLTCLSLQLVCWTAYAQQPVKPASSAPVAKPAPTPDRTVREKRNVRAQLSARRYTTLASELGARISRITVKEGDRFKAGQTLISFDCSMQAAQQQKARAVLRGAEQAYGSNQRLEELHSVGKIELENSRSEVDKARADVALMNTTLSKCSLGAPFSGRVAEQKVREQQFVQPGQAIMDILDDSTLELEFIVPSKWLAWLKVDNRFQVRIDETTRTYPARITRIGARVDPVSQSVKMAAVIDGSFPELIAGMSGEVQLAPPASQ